MAAKIKISIGKEADKSFNVAEQMEVQVRQFTSYFFRPTDQFDEMIAEIVYNMVYDYIEKYDRILYAPITNEIYRHFNEADENNELSGDLLTNLDQLLSYAYSGKPEKAKPCKKDIEKRRLVDTKKAILKIRDHANLAQQQYNDLKQSDAEYKEKFERQFGETGAKLTKEMNAQMLTMVGMFTALAFLLFGGISSLDNIFSVHGIPLLKLVVVASVWGLGIVNLVFIFLFCVGKMTDLDFKSNEDPDADIFQKYPIVWWTDLMLLSVLLLSAWAYYIQASSSKTLFRVCQSSHPMIFSSIGTIVIIVGVVLVAFFLMKHLDARMPKNLKKESEEKQGKKNRSGLIITVLSILLIIAIGWGVMQYLNNKKATNAVESWPTEIEMEQGSSEISE